MGLGDRFRQDQPVRFPIEVKDFRIPAPVHRRFKLAFDLILAEMLIEDVIEKFFRNRVICLGMKNAVDLLEDHDVR